MREWVQRLIGPDPAMTAVLREVAQERDELAEDVDSLAVERDDLTIALQVATETQEDLRRELLAAYEPIEVGTCRKIRHITRDTAEHHAMRVARKEPGAQFNAYECRVCPPYLVFGNRPYHAGHCRLGDAGSFHVLSGVAHYTCGCQCSARTGELLWQCATHRRVAS
jgi:hypothetical protein